MVKLIIEALLADVKDISDVGEAKEVLHIVQAIRLGVRVRQLRVDLWLTKCLPSHLQVPDEIILFASAVGNFDHFSIVRRILSLDIRV